MWKIDMDDSSDLNFAISCLVYKSVNLDEFKLWVLNVIRDTPIEDVPSYIFDLAGFNEPLFHIANVIGFAPHGDLSDEDIRSLYGIAVKRGMSIYNLPISKDEALNSLTKNPDLIDKFKKFFPFIKLPEL